MELINHTALPAELFVSEVAEDRTRVGTLIAKATFEVRGGGAVLDTEQPVPVLSTDEPVELGLLPSDVMMRFEEGLDVYVLAAAYSPSGQPAEGVEVGLRFGSYDPLVLRVFGDRQWVGDRESSAISASGR